MSILGGIGCGDGILGDNDTILWFIILFLLIFCNNRGVLGVRDNC